MAAGLGAGVDYVDLLLGLFVNFICGYIAGCLALGSLAVIGGVFGVEALIRSRMYFLDVLEKI